MGNDVGGSLRCPAALCGIYSLKPTKSRDISFRKMKNLAPSNLYIKVCSGFMSASVDGLVEAYSAMWNNDKLYLMDPDIAPLHWRNDIFVSEKRLKIGYFWNGIVLEHPGFKRAVLETKEKLKSLGHELVEFDPPPFEEIGENFSGFVMNDNFVGLGKVLEEDGIVDSSLTGIKMYRSILQYTPKIVLRLINSMLSYFTKFRIHRKKSLLFFISC